MRRTAIVALSLVALAATISFAQTDTICLYPDVAGNSCNIDDTVPGLIEVYVLHTTLGGAMGAQFKIETNAPLTWIADTSPHVLTLGNTLTGFSVGYGSCMTGVIHVVTALFFGSGVTPPGTPMSVVADPASSTGGIEVLDCNSVIWPATGGTAFISSSSACACGNPGPDPLLLVSPIALDFGDTQTNGNFTISNIGGGTLEWTVSESIPWLDVTHTSGTGNEVVGVSIDRSGLPTGNHSAQISITSNGGNETVTVDFAVVVPTPALIVFPLLIDFPWDVNEMIFLIDNSGTGTLEWNVSANVPWLSFDQTAGAGFANVHVYVDRTGLADGTHPGTIHVTSNGGDADIAVELDVLTLPILRVSPLSLAFSPAVTRRLMTINNDGAPILNWTITPDQPWIWVAPPLSGSGNHTTLVDVDPSLVPPGTTNGSITVSSNGGTEVVSVVYSEGLPTTGGKLSLYGDAAGTNCLISDVAPGIFSVYVIHELTAGATASQFSVPIPACMTGVLFLNDETPFLWIGGSPTGIAVSYQACLAAPIQVLKINYFGQGTSQPCCQMFVAADPEAPTGMVEVVDCNFIKHSALSGTAVVNPDGSCGCALIAVETTTWGAVKALFKDE